MEMKTPRVRTPRIQQHDPNHCVSCGKPVTPQEKSGDACQKCAKEHAEAEAYHAEAVSEALEERRLAEEERSREMSLMEVERLAKERAIQEELVKEGRDAEEALEEWRFGKQVRVMRDIDTDEWLGLKERRERTPVHSRWWDM